MDYSPHTPSHSRNHSLAGSSPASSPNARRRSSLLEPLTPLRNSFNQQDALDMGDFGGGGAQSGLGNLADELADAFSESGEEDEYDDDGDGAPGIRFDVQEDEGRGAVEAVRDSGVDTASPGADGSRPKSMSLNLPSPRRRAHRRAGSEYDGSEYGSESDFEPPGIPLSLVSKINAVEALARRGAESTGGHSDGVFQRVTAGLKDLGSQSGVESTATRSVSHPLPPTTIDALTFPSTGSSPHTPRSRHTSRTKHGSYKT
ncbi:hypothetical protein IMZ48_15300 [Candidatus Bathyarchaeota archaeon]|nr:hypothetical protein [Candidatus Bathyarchaeota archaeon]